MSINKNAPITGTANQGATQKKNLNNDCTTMHPAWERVQGIIDDLNALLSGPYMQSLPGPAYHRYDARTYRGALLRCLMIYLINSPNNRADRATTIRELAKQTGYTLSDVRGVITWLVGKTIIRQLATADASVTLTLTDGGDNEY